MNPDSILLLGPTVPAPAVPVADLAAAVATASGRPLAAGPADQPPGSVAWTADPAEAGASPGRRVVWFDVPPDALAARLGGADPVLVDRRRATLAASTLAADAIVADDGQATVGELARRVTAVDAAPSEHRIEVAFGDGRSYPVVVGPGTRHNLADLVPPRAARVAVVTQDGIGVDVDPGREHRVFTVPDGEEAKRLEVVGELASGFARWGMTRRDVVVSVGGGVVSDLAGFVAATYHRGIEVVHVSTTLLGQIDAAIGGKCGVNLPEGKNLVGAFKQPVAVVCDTETLATLPAAEFLSGMGELAKYHFLGGGELDRRNLADRVAASVAIKAGVVTDDETEGGRRAVLNYGHTLAHALESVTGYRIRHGEAVAVGLVYAAELAHRLGRIDRRRVDEHRRVVATYGLAATAPDGIDRHEVVEAFGRDKKALDGITFVLDGPGGVEPVVVDDRELLADVLDTVVGDGAGAGR